MLGFVAGAGVCALGVLFLHVSVRLVLRKSATERRYWKILLIAAQPLPLAALLLALACWNPGQTIYVAAGVAASYVGYAIHAVVRMRQRARYDAAKGG